MLLRRDATYVTSAILPIRNVDLTSLPIARILVVRKKKGPSLSSLLLEPIFMM